MNWVLCTTDNSQWHTLLPNDSIKIITWNNTGRSKLTHWVYFQNACFSSVKTNKRPLKMEISCLFLNIFLLSWTWLFMSGWPSLWIQFSCSVMSDSVTPWIAACQASLSITNSRSPPKLMCIESVTPSNHFILCTLDYFNLILLPKK